MIIVIRRLLSIATCVTHSVDQGAGIVCALAAGAVDLVLVDHFCEFPSGTGLLCLVPGLRVYLLCLRSKKEKARVWEEVLYLGSREEK